MMVKVNYYNRNIYLLKWIKNVIHV